MEKHKEEIIRMFKEGKTNQEIGEKFDRSASCIWMNLKKWGYSRPRNAKRGGTIEVNCDYCGTLYKIKRHQIKKFHKDIKKFACKKCAHKKQQEICQKLHGVNSPFQREEVKEKIKETNLEKYGVENPFEATEIKEKIKQTHLENLGVENPMESDKIKNKLKQTMQKKYGVDHSLQVKEFKEKQEQTTLERYGHKSAMQSSEIKEKQQQTMQNRYGVDNPNQLKEIRERIEQTNLEKYGYKHTFQIPEIKEKSKETNIKKYGYEVVTKNPDIIKKIKQTRIDKGLTRTYQDKNAYEWAEKLKRSYTSLNELVRKYGWEKAISIKPKRTYIEDLMGNWLKEINIEYIERRKLFGQIPDFYIPKHDLIIETDGLYWHSDGALRNKPKDFHKLRQEKFKQKGLKTLFFREDEINEKPEIIQSIIRNKLNQNQKIFARKCKIIDCNSNEFFINNHLMGKGQGKIFGLEYNGKLVCCLQFRCRSKKNKVYEISRFCPTLNTSIVGGFSRLLNHAEKIFSPNQTFTFIDKRYGSGQYLKNLGFEFKNCHLSFRWTKNGKTVHRMQFPGNSGYEKGFFKIWDCGQAKWIKNY